MFKEDEKFDLEIRSILEGGKEEVPDHLWAAIESRLEEIPAAAGHGRRRVVPAWLKKTAAVTSAAAAIAVAVIFSRIADDSTSGTLAEENIAVVTPEERTEGNTGILVADIPSEGKEIPEKETTVIRETSVNTVPDAVVSPESLYPEIQEEEHTVTEPAAAPEEKPGSTVSGQKEAKDASEDRERVYPDLNDPYGDFSDSDNTRKRKVRTSFTLFGNAVSNTNSESAGAKSYMAPSNESPKESTVRENNESVKYSVPLSFGAGVKFEITPHWSVSVGLNYSLLSRTFDGNFYNVRPDGTYTDTHYADIRNVQNYIGIPVNAYYSIVRGSFVDFYAYAGGTAEYCLTNRYFMQNSSGKTIHDGDAGSFQFSANAGIGVEFILARQLGIYIDPSLRYYFRNSNAPKSIRTAQPLMLGFEAGLRVRF